MSARQARLEGETAAAQGLAPLVHKLMNSEDAKEGVRAMIEKRARGVQGLLNRGRQIGFAGQPAPARAYVAGRIALIKGCRE